MLTAVGADAPKGVGAFEASGGYPEVLVEDWTATDVSAFDAPAPTLLNENGCGDLEDAGGYIVAGAFVTSLAGERSELLGFADGATQALKSRVFSAITTITLRFITTTSQLARCACLSY